MELKHEGCSLDAAGAFYVPLREYKKPNTVTPSTLSIDTPGDKRNLPVESRFEDALKRDALKRDALMTEAEKWKNLSVKPRRTWTLG